MVKREQRYCKMDEELTKHNKSLLSKRFLRSFYKINLGLNVFKIFIKVLSKKMKM